MNTSLPPLPFHPASPSPFSSPNVAIHLQSFSNSDVTVRLCCEPKIRGIVLHRVVKDVDFCRGLTRRDFSSPLACILSAISARIATIRSAASSIGLPVEHSGHLGRDPGPCKESIVLHQQTAVQRSTSTRLQTLSLLQGSIISPKISLRESVDQSVKIPR